MKTAIISALAAAALAAPASLTSAASDNEQQQHPYQWQVIKWSGGCARHGCYYYFNITGPAQGEGVSQIPAFSAYCSDSEGGVGGPYALCTLNDDGQPGRAVKSKLLPAETGTGAHIQVSYQFNVLSQEGTYFNYTGHTVTSYNQFVAPEANFTITPDEAFGVA